ncbi:LuxR C-terminal-related transcriptional regulator [Kaistella yonginensis]|uniref:LuxR C-terminal-related transcriptional regulator n=1 Tax=Kaistella yonginensis TaxID=658267 RepID=UPI0025B57D35|nr:response regulator transcription factor [Kaistella yonginensis]MDN3607951.1 response regulator transcription factor [Kaistella yonginensis]
MKNKVILYDQQRLYLHSMKALLNQSALTKNFKVETCDSFKKVEESNLDENDILILNSMGLNSLELIRQVEYFMQVNPKLKIIVHTMNADAKSIKRIFDKGIKGFLGSGADSEEFLASIKEVSAGKVFINTDVKNLLLNSICSVEDQPERTYGKLEGLTAREKEVLLLICDGLRSKEIAEKLFISTHTVESHRRNMMLKFNLNSSSKLVKFAMENKLVEY